MTEDKSTLEIFHTYDIRGLSPSQLDYKAAFLATLAYLRLVPGKKYTVGHDIRSTSEEIFAGIADAIELQNKQLDFLGLAPTDMMYFATANFNYDGGLMVTASHNPKEWNGIKFVKEDAQPVDMERLKQEYLNIAQEFSGELKFNGKRRSYPITNYEREYTKHLLHFINSDEISDLKLVIDAGNGMSSILIPEVLSNIPKLSYSMINSKLDSSFPAHPPDPSNKANTAQLSQKVVEKNANLGVAFDGDADRCFLIDEQGQYIRADQLAGLISTYLGSKNGNLRILYDFRSTYLIESIISKNGFEGIQVTPGRSNFLSQMKKRDADLGFEISGHFFFKDNFYTDSGVIPLLIVLQVMSESQKPLSELLKEYRMQFFASGDINFKIEDRDQFIRISNKLVDGFPGSIAGDDYLACEQENWRFTLRPSNTQPLVRLNIEAKSEAVLSEVTSKVKELISETGAVLE